jgi:hypothetical protein
MSKDHVASIFRVDEYAKQETRLKAGGKERNRLAEISE